MDDSEDLNVLDPEGADFIRQVIMRIDAYNDLVTAHLKEDDSGSRYKEVSDNLDSIIKELNDKLNDIEKETNDDLKSNALSSFLGIFSKLRKKVSKQLDGSIKGRFEEVKNTAELVFNSMNEQVKREEAIADAYRGFRTELRFAGMVSTELAKKAEERRDSVVAQVEENQRLLDEAMANGEETGSFEIQRDKLTHQVNIENKRYESAVMLASALTKTYVNSEVLMEKMMSSTAIKDRTARQGSMFYVVGGSVFATLNASINQLVGLHEGVKLTETFNDRMNQMQDMVHRGGNKLEKKAEEAAFNAAHIDVEKLLKQQNDILRQKAEIDGSRMENLKLLIDNQAEAMKAHEQYRESLSEIASGKIKINVDDFDNMVKIQKNAEFNGETSEIFGSDILNKLQNKKKMSVNSDNEVATGKKLGM